MSNLRQVVADTIVPRGSLGVWWLSQAGFVFKSPAGKVVYLDPYLSDAVERLFGFRRLSLPAIDAEDVRTDYVVLTHEHNDHLDPDSLPVIAKNNPACRFIAASGCAAGLDEAGISPASRVMIEANRHYDLGDFVVQTVPADHGDQTDKALCLLLEFDGVRVFCTGDTALQTRAIEPLCDPRPDVVLCCINGGFGNMGHVDAARMVAHIKPRLAVPCHYWTFAEQGAGDPAGFVHACRSLCPEVNARLLKPGEYLHYPSRDSN